MRQVIPVALTIAGSDNSAGAGAQADLKTFGAFGVYGLTAITCVVAEVPARVSAIQAVDPAIVAEQVRLSFEFFPVGAVKTGLLYSKEIVEAVCDSLEKTGRGAPLVVDPVMVASSGKALLKPDAVAVYEERLFPMAALVTPNLDEAATLLGRSVSTESEMREAVEELSKRFGAPFLLKGGHLAGAAATDLLYNDGRIYEFSAPFVSGVRTHGTGCTYSAAIAAGLARGLALKTAIGEAKRFVTRAIGKHFLWEHHGHATAALNHLPKQASWP
jgi:hydroxymethylpyrimidine/phosphomethylpyrimidine kinase